MSFLIIVNTATLLIPGLQIVSNQFIINYMYRILFNHIVLVLLLFTLSASSCAGGNSNNPAEDLLAPSNLKVNVQIVGATASAPAGDGTGKVNFQVTASNATFFQVETNGQTQNINGKDGGTVSCFYSSNPGQTTTYDVKVTALNDKFQQKDTTFQVSVLYNPPLQWSDEFDGTTLNTANWSVETGIHVNNELQTYTGSGNYSIANGILTITCKKVNDAGVYGSYTSARLNTYGKKSFKYGRMEARLKLPKGKGTWPAFWMLGNSIQNGTSWPKCGEIDIMEYVGADPLWVQGSLHSQSQSGGNARNGRCQLLSTLDESEWHVYGIIWTDSKLSFYVDDYTKPYYTCMAPATKTAENWPYDDNFFVILNLAFGGDWGGYKGIDASLDNMTYQIDWVRYYGQ